jgi:hypothetical protein
MAHTWHGSRMRLRLPCCREPGAPSRPSIRASSFEPVRSLSREGFHSPEEHRTHNDQNRRRLQRLSLRARFFDRVAANSRARDLCFRRPRNTRPTEPRHGAARKAGSFEGTLPRLFLLRNPESFCRRRCGSWAKHQLHSDSKPSNPNLRDLTQLPTEWLPTHKT